MKSIFCPTLSPNQSFKSCAAWWPWRNAQAWTTGTNMATKGPLLKMPEAKATGMVIRHWAVCKVVGCPKIRNLWGWFLIVDDGMMVFHLGEDLNLQLLKGGWIFRILGKTFKKLGEKHEFGKNMNSTHENHESSSVNIFARPMIGCSLWLEISVFGHAKQSHQCFAKSDWLNQSAYKTKQKTHHHVGKKLFLSQPLITSTSLTFILVHFKTHKNMCIQ